MYYKKINDKHSTIHKNVHCKGRTLVKRNHTDREDVAREEGKIVVLAEAAPD